MTHNQNVIKLYEYWRSSASYRVRIALNLKKIPYESVAINLKEGQQQSPSYQAINRQGLVPTLEINGRYLSQSLAIIDYLDHLYPDPPLLPSEPFKRAKVIEFSHIIASDTHPLNNLRVLAYLEQKLHIDDKERKNWYFHWLDKCFTNLNFYISQEDFKGYCFGKNITLADICLVPQVYNALRFGLDVTKYRFVAEVHSNCLRLPAFERAQPEKQKDASL